MTVEAVIAIYGAVLASALAGLEVAKWIASRRTRVRIEIQPAMSGAADPAAHALGRHPLCVYAEVINESDRSEQVAWIWFEEPDSKGIWNESAGVGPNVALPPRSRASYLFAEGTAAAEIEGADIEMRSVRSDRFRVKVLLGTGQQVYSPVEQLPEWLALGADD